MKSILKSLCVAAVLAFTVSDAKTAQADHNPYWRNHWTWYDNTYTPYYNYYYGPTYGGYYGGYAQPYYGGGYYYSSPGYYRSYYGPSRNYYVAPRVGVRVGRANFGWW